MTWDDIAKTQCDGNCWKKHETLAQDTDQFTRTGQSLVSSIAAVGQTLAWTQFG